MHTSKMIDETDLEQYKMSKFEKSIKSGRLTEDLLSEVRSIWEGQAESPTIKKKIDVWNSKVHGKYINFTALT